MPYSHNGTPEQTVLRSMCRAWTLWNIPMGRIVQGTYDPRKKLKGLYRRGHHMRECIVMASFIIIPLYTLHTLCRVGSSDFLRSLCFVWFWFGLKILRLVYKKAFFKTLNGSILFDFLTSKKIASSLIRVFKKYSSKLDAKGIERSWILLWFQKCVKLFHSRNSQRFFLRKTLFAISLKNLIFCKNCFPFFLIQALCTFFKSAQNSASVYTLCGLFSEDKRSNKIETIQYFKNA